MGVVRRHGFGDSGNVTDVKAAVTVALVTVRSDRQLARLGHRDEGFCGLVLMSQRFSDGDRKAAVDARAISRSQSVRRLRRPDRRRRTASRTAQNRPMVDPLCDAPPAFRADALTGVGGVRLSIHHRTLQAVAETARRRRARPSHQPTLTATCVEVLILGLAGRLVVVRGGVPGHRRAGRDRV